VTGTARVGRACAGFLPGVWQSPSRCRAHRVSAHRGEPAGFGHPMAETGHPMAETGHPMAGTGRRRGGWRSVWVFPELGCGPVPPGALIHSSPLTRAALGSECQEVEQESRRLTKTMGGV